MLVSILKQVLTILVLPGQLGTSANDNALTPQIVLGPWVSPTGEPAAPKRLLNEFQGQSNVRLSLFVILSFGTTCDCVSRVKSRGWEVVFCWCWREDVSLWEGKRNIWGRVRGGDKVLY